MILKYWPANIYCETHDNKIFFLNILNKIIKKFKKYNSYIALELYLND
jgi:hypothetical protein